MLRKINSFYEKCAEIKICKMSDIWQALFVDQCLGQILRLYGEKMQETDPAGRRGSKGLG